MTGILINSNRGLGESRLREKFLFKLKMWLYFQNTFLQETVRRECEERFELTEALSVAREELLQMKRPAGMMVLSNRHSLTHSLTHSTHSLTHTHIHVLYTFYIIFHIL